MFWRDASFLLIRKRPFFFFCPPQGKHLITFFPRFSRSDLLTGNLYAVDPAFRSAYIIRLPAVPGQFFDAPEAIRQPIKWFFLISWHCIILLLGIKNTARELLFPCKAARKMIQYPWLWRYHFRYLNRSSVGAGGRFLIIFFLVIHIFFIPGKIHVGLIILTAVCTRLSFLVDQVQIG